MNRFLILLLFLLPFHFFSQNDSLLVTQLFDSLRLNPTDSTHFWELINSLEQRNKDNPKITSDIYYNRAKHYLISGKLEEALQVKEQGLIEFKNYPSIIPKFYNIEGTIYSYQRNFHEAIKSYRTALTYYDDNDKIKEAAIIKNNIANIFFNLNDFESAYNYAFESFQVLFQEKDTLLYPQIAAILAISEAKTNKLEDAVEHANLAIINGGKYKNIVAIILGKYALGDIYFEQKSYQKAKEYYKDVIAQTKQYNLIQFEILGRIGILRCAIILEEYEEAIHAGEKIIENNNLINSHTADYTVFQQISIAYNAIGDYKQAYYYLDKANTMYREYSSTENKKNIQELLTKYETEKKERELSEKELELLKLNNLIIILISALIFLIVIIVGWRRLIKSRLLKLEIVAKQEQMNAFIEGEKRERERIAADIHDGVASTLTGLSLRLEQVKSLEEIPQFSNYLRDVRNEVRQISKNIQPFNFKETGWVHAFQNFLNSVNSSNFKTFLITDFDESEFNNDRGIVIYRILQEFIQNTLKHANASECEILITEGSKRILIQYSDNGKNVEEETLKKGNGWQSILLRLKAINGKIKTPYNPIGGLKIDIFLPKLNQ